jgi:membrane protein implicated in regulation of membrane protease activity
MESYLWIFWAILGAMLVVAEIFTTGFVLLWFGLGALAAGLAGLLGVHSITLQFLIFAVVSIALTAASRTIFVNYFSREKTGGDLKTGVEALPGKVGTVVSSSRGAMNEGAVKVFGSTWTAVSGRWRRASGSGRPRRGHAGAGSFDLCQKDWRRS